MRVLVTGASGFTGRYLVPLLRARGDEVHELAADLTDTGAVGAEVIAVQPEAVVHLAARSAVTDDVSDLYRVNQLGTFALLDALAAVAPGIRVLLASSAQVYRTAEGLIDEAAATGPLNDYGLSKLAMEQGAARWADRLQLIIVRPFNYAGAGQAELFLLPKLVAHFARRAPMLELGNTETRRDYGDVRAVAAAYVGLLHASTAPMTVNIGTGRLWSVADILATLTQMTGHRPTLRVDPALIRGSDPAALGCDNRRLRALLPDWSPIALEDTLRWMLGAAQV